ncbi:low molecular weight phosphotyrosine protein phosphatase [Altererythrobacter indicus]|uniref:protein-tyrosine-phosphatase n=1 Tax=Altericroceibacterium indicum TaxID=374177 RepID=A0A845A4I5_9SPHN|nr:low molecular weight protein-tyrosine-phosphatase [Altericroceibacterium indicum]MXP25202.1 low molecular weight phosphotyrosine protein phosphatase [Altericroceibacterium indicum]
MKPAVLFVCLGNICRSPMAEGAFRAAADEAGLDIIVDSAGTGDWHIGNAPDPRAQKEAASHGVSIAHLRGRQIGEDDYRKFSHIFALDKDNLAIIQQRAPEDTTAEISLLMDVVEGERGRPVADPYYGGAEGFTQTWCDVSKAARALVDRFSR